MSANSGTPTPWYKSRKMVRHAVMLFFFLFLSHVAIEHLLKGGGPRGTPSVEAYCPFGGLESLYQFITTGGFIRRIEPSAMLLLVAVILLTLIASRGFCGWICPFGSLQEWVGMLGRRIFKKRFNPTGAWDRALRYLKYVILAVIISLTWHTGSLVFRDYDPFLAFFHFGKGIDEMPWAYAALGVTLVGSLIIERFFCKYACPLGAVLGIVGKIGLTKIERDPAGCKECNLCHQKCNARVDFLSSTSIRSAECNQCLDCVVDCPCPGVLSVKGPRWRLSHPGFAALLIVSLAVFVTTSKLSGKWRTKPEVISFTDPAGKLDPENIRGWMTLQEVSDGYNVPLERLYEACGIPARVPASTPLNRVAGEYEVEFRPDSMREYVREFVSGEASGLEPRAGKKLRSEAGKKESHAGGEGQEVRGFMTLNEISLKTGVPKDFLFTYLGVPSTIDPRKPVREWIHEHGKTIQDLRDAVAEYRAREK